MAITLSLWGFMRRSTYHRKWNDMYYPYVIVLPENISKLIPLSIKQNWVHYPNLCATKIFYRIFFKGWYQWQPTQIINNISLWHWWHHSNAILNLYLSWSPWNYASILHSSSCQTIGLGWSIVGMDFWFSIMSTIGEWYCRLMSTLGESLVSKRFG